MGEEWQGGWDGFGQVLDRLVSCQRWKKKAMAELMELTRLRAWWPQVKGREIPRSVVLYQLQRVENCRHRALLLYRMDKEENKSRKEGQQYEIKEDGT